MVGAKTLGDESPFGFLFSFYPKNRVKDQTRPDPAHDLPSDRPYYSTALELGSHWERTTHPLIDWQFVQRGPNEIQKGIYDWSIPDNFLRHIPVSLKLVVNLWPGYERLTPKGWKFKAKDEAMRAMVQNAYLSFVKKAVERYDGDGIEDMPGLTNPVRHWQILNEPSSKPVMTGACSPGPQCASSEWQKPDELFEFLKITVEAIRSADRTARVLAPGTVDVGGRINDLVYRNLWSRVIELRPRVDIFDIHWFGVWSEFKAQYQRYRLKLNEAGMSQVPIWVTESGSPSHKRGERWQALDHVRRFVYPLALGVEKIFRAWSLVEGWPPFDCKSDFDFTGLIYDGLCEGDLGYGQKKLAFYSYRQTTEKLKNSRWKDVRILREEKGGLYLFEFPQRPGGSLKTLYVGWMDDEDPKSPKKGRATFKVDGGSVVRVTEGVPRGDHGKDHHGKAWSEIFASQKINPFRGKVEIEFGVSPQFIEIMK